MLSPDLPFPVVGGGRMRTVSLLRSMARCANVEMVCMSYELPSETAAWARGLGIEISILQPKPPRLLGKWIRWIASLYTMCNLEYDVTVLERIRGKYDKIRPDILWLETPYLIRYAVTVAKGIPLVVDYWGTSEGAEREFRHAAGARKLWHWARWMTAFGGERTYAPQVTDIVTVSEGDAAHFRKLAPLCRVHSVPMGVEFAAHSSGEMPQEDPLLMMMTGDLSYKPNVDAAAYFAGTILPLIRQQVPGAKVLFAGSHPCSEVLDLGKLDGVLVKGFVPDLGVLIAGAAVYVLPMRLGSGIRTKLFDVFPVARPIVTTTIGAEGLALVDGANCRMADSPELFVSACVHLLRNEAERRRFGSAAQQLIRTVYSQDASDRCVRNVFKSALANSCNSG